MKLFGPLYDRVISYSAHQHAPRYLAALSFAESSFFPVPPDVMLMPMVIARPDQGVRLAFITTFFSVLGGIFGYLVGYFAYTLIEPWLFTAGYGEALAQAKAWFDIWGVWIVLIAGFSPIPYKLFTITAGALSMLLLPFVIASFIGRGMRFFAVALLIAWLGPRVVPKLRPYIEWMGWVTVFLLVIVLILFQIR